MLRRAFFLAALVFDIFRTGGAGELSDFNRKSLVLLVRHHHPVMNQFQIDRAARREKEKRGRERGKEQKCVEVRDSGGGAIVRINGLTSGSHQNSLST